MAKRLLLLAWIACTGWAGTIYSLSCLSGEEVGRWMPPVSNFDKVCHFVAYGAGGAVFAFALRHTWKMRSLPLALIATAIVSLYGATDEWHQLSTPGRSGADLGDWMADTLGGAAGAVIIATTYVRNLSTGSLRADQRTAARDQRA